MNAFSGPGVVLGDGNVAADSTKFHILQVGRKIINKHINEQYKGKCHKGNKVGYIGIK